MAQLKCTSKYTYPFEYQLKQPGGTPATYTATGSTKDAAEAAALKDVPDSDVKAALDAADADAKTNSCLGACALNVTLGDPEFVATTTYDANKKVWTAVISAAEVEVTAACVKKKIKKPKLTLSSSILLDLLPLPSAPIG